MLKLTCGVGIWSAVRPPAKCLHPSIGGPKFESRLWFQIPAQLVCIPRETANDDSSILFNEPHV